MRGGAVGDTHDGQETIEHAKPNPNSDVPPLEEKIKIGCLLLAVKFCVRIELGEHVLDCLVGELVSFDGLDVLLVEFADHHAEKLNGTSKPHVRSFLHSNPSKSCHRAQHDEGQRQSLHSARANVIGKASAKNTQRADQQRYALAALSRDRG